MKKYFILSLILLFALGIFSYKVTLSFFSDTETSTNNVFTAAAVFATPSASPSASPSPTPSGIATHLVISEVQINGANANEDFVELYNPTSLSVDLSGWKIRKRASNGTETSLVLISTGKSIPAHGFFLWANNQGGFSTTVGADESNGNNISENNSLGLLMPDNTIIDQVAWGNGTSQFVEGTAFPNSPATSQSIERKALSTSTAPSMASGGTDEFKGNGFDAGDNATDFILRTTSQPQNSGSATETL